jgi:hypothetical protein
MRNQGQRFFSAPVMLLLLWRNHPFHKSILFLAGDVLRVCLRLGVSNSRMEGLSCGAFVLEYKYRLHFRGCLKRGCGILLGAMTAMKVFRPLGWLTFFNVMIPLLQIAASRVGMVGNL